MTAQQEPLNTQISYDRVAREYAQRIFDELTHKPLDRQLLDRFVEQTRGRGLVCDLGCGPGHVACYLRSQGAEVIGLDLSPGMLDQARRLNPALEFRQADMLALDEPDESWAGVAAFYSIIHTPHDKLPQLFRELKRVLRPGGSLLLAFHSGRETLHVDELWGQEVSFDFFLFEPDEIASLLTSAGFELEEVIMRPPYPEIEYQSQRAYIFAKRPELKGS